MEKHQTHQPTFPPLPIGTAYQTLKSLSQGVLVCCDSWQHIPVGKWWTGSGESKINYEVGEISALQITVQWFHWNGCVWQRIQTHTAGQNAQTLLYGIAACMGREGALLGKTSLSWETARGDFQNMFVREPVTYGSVWVWLLGPGRRVTHSAQTQHLQHSPGDLLVLEMPPTVCTDKAPAHPKYSISTSVWEVCRGSLASGIMNR